MPFYTGYLNRKGEFHGFSFFVVLSGMNHKTGISQYGIKSMSETDHPAVAARAFALVPDEIEMIENYRARKARQEAARVFQSKAIATAHAFQQWSDKTGQGLTFSTFINTFNYQDNDGRRMYEAVERILDAARCE